MAGIYLLLILFGPYIAVLLEPLFLKKELNNPIVNRHYPGWHEVQLDEHISMKLPERWVIEVDEHILIYDETGKVVLRGEKIDGGTDASEREAITLRLLSVCAGRNVDSYSQEYFSTNRFANTARVSWLCIGDEEKVTSIYFQHTTSNPLEEYAYRLCFVDSTGNYCDIAEAIAWSESDD